MPTEVAFGMAETPAMQDAVDRLQKRGVTRIAAIPLFISSHSPIIGNFRYILGLQDTLGTRTRLKHLDRVRSTAKFQFSGAMDGDPLISEILYDRAKAISKDPAKTNLVIIGHGPNDEEDNKLWLKDMEQHAAYLKQKGFRTVEVLTHRNDAPPEIKQAAKAAFRQRVEAAGRDGETVVVPLLMSAGGIEKEVEGDLEGLKFSFGKPLAPHPNLQRWVEARFQALTATAG
jgi:sirohydrochlorin ferrochelatase